jgi:hypothetical protein
MLALGDHQPVPVTLDRVDGITTHYLTPVTLQVSRSGQRASLRATLTAPDGSQETGIGSIDGVVWSRDLAAITTKVSFQVQALADTLPERSIRPLVRAGHEAVHRDAPCHR